MRICLIASLYRPYILGGAEVYVHELAEHLAGRHEVAVITSSPYAGRSSLVPSVEDNGRLKVYRFFPLNAYHLSRRPSARYLKVAWTILDVYNWHSRLTVDRLLRQIKPDIVHSHNLRGLSVSVWDAVKGRGLPLVHTLHDYHLLCQTSMLWHPGTGPCDRRTGVCRVYSPVMRRLADSKPDLVLSPSKYVLQQHLERGLFARSRHAVVPYGLASPPADAAAAGALGAALHVLYIGTVSRHKGVRNLVQAFCQLSAPGARLEIAGTGDSEMAECQRLAGSDPRITFLGFVNGVEKERAFARASVVAVPSIWPDNLPVTILESQARGKVVVASRVGGIPELIESGVNGLLVEPDDVGALALSLERLRDDPAFVARLARGARQTGRGFSMAEHSAKLQTLYDGALGR